MLPRVLYLIFYLSVITSVIVLVVTLFGNNSASEETILKKSKNISNSFGDILKCNDKLLKTNIEYHGQYIIFRNFVKAEKQYKYNESITLSVPADYRFLDNIIPLAERWKGPISVALYAPGHDFFTSLKCIAYLRKCSHVADSIKKEVTFHLFFEHEHIPNQVSFAEFSEL